MISGDICKVCRLPTPEHYTGCPRGDRIMSKTKTPKAVPVNSPEGKAVLREVNAKLEAWLDKIGARCMWQLTRGKEEKPHSFVECWMANGRIFIIERYQDSGWQIYTGNDSNAIDATFADAERRLGFEFMSPVYGPWVGVSKENQTVCMVLGCTHQGKPNPCPYDGAHHHHGCIHYDCEAAKVDVKRTGFKFRQGWGLLCDEHYNALCGGK